jgi:predicted 2-oxoglutarate/Fe(II)-dependent dioxygenase YbiX
VNSSYVKYSKGVLKMAFQSFWYQTKLPTEIVDIIEKDISVYDSSKTQSLLIGDKINESKRNSENTWIPTSYWLGGFMWHYIQRANRENFLYDLTAIDNESMQYTFYDVGQFYDWHTDSSLAIYKKPENFDQALTPSPEYIRKLSVILQLSNEEDYQGGNIELMSDEGEVYTAPKEKGTFIVFDSRTKHRVTEITGGLRKSVVAWVVGPRWK